MVQLTNYVADIAANEAILAKLSHNVGKSNRIAVIDSFLKKQHDTTHCHVFVPEKVFAKIPLMNLIVGRWIRIDKNADGSYQLWETSDKYTNKPLCGAAQGITLDKDGQVIAMDYYVIQTKRYFDASRGDSGRSYAERYTDSLIQSLRARGISARCRNRPSNSSYQ